MALTNEQIEHYSRHIILKEVGAKGQKKLLNARVLIIGAGGLGAPAALYLAAAGVGTIGIADADTVDLSNLQRQGIHTTADIGKPKVQSAKESMEAINPDVNVITYHKFLTGDNILDIIKEPLIKSRLTAWRAICLHIFRHLARKLLAGRQPSGVVFIQSDEKSDCASCTPDLISDSLKTTILFSTAPTISPQNFSSTMPALWRASRFPMRGSSGSRGSS